MQILNRNEMKNIIAGSGEGCTDTNCWMCSTGGFHCTTPGEGTLPEEDGVTCSWGVCDICCGPDEPIDNI